MSRAFCKWLQRESSGDAKIAALALYQILTSNPSGDNEVWNLLEATGDKNYTAETFEKAAKVALEVA